MTYDMGLLQWSKILRPVIKQVNPITPQSLDSSNRLESLVGDGDLKVGARNGRGARHTRHRDIPLHDFDLRRGSRGERQGQVRLAPRRSSGTQIL